MLRQLLFKLGLCSVALCGASAVLAAEAGRVVFVTGQVQLANRPAALDAAVQEGDEMSTGATGYIYVKTVDGGFLILRPNSKARITTYHVDVNTPANTHVKLELLDGVARSISGQAVKQARQNFRFNTPVAAIGVRGTDFIVYTDQQTSRVAVVSGGVVVSAFAGACGPEGGGPCEGSGSRELFAGQPGMLLQIQRGQHVPNLMHNPALSPDQSTPPRVDEPVGKVSSAPMPAAPSTPLAVAPVEVSLDAQKNASVLIITKGPGNGTPPGGNANGNGTPSVGTGTPSTGSGGVVLPETPPVVISPPVIVPPVEVVKGPPEVIWGRYAAVAGAGPDTEVVATLGNGKYSQTYTIGPYAIGRVNTTALVLPTEGTASFALISSEAQLQKTGQEPVAAVVKDGKLDINFATKTFTTSLLVVSPEAELKVTGAGSVATKGAAVGTLANSFTSGSNIRGFLGGAKADEAAYIFKSVNSPTLTATGATQWSR
ncbi:MAG: FecR family protein [Pseudomonadota bacterium]